MWNPFKKKPEPSIWSTALVYDHEIVDLGLFFGSAVKDYTDLLISKGIPVKRVLTFMHTWQGIKVQDGYELQKEYIQRDSLTKYSWRKVNVK